MIKSERISARVTKKTQKKLSKASKVYGISKSYIISNAIDLFLRDILKK